MGPADLPDRFLLIPLLEFVHTAGQTSRTHEFFQSTVDYICDGCACGGSGTPGTRSLQG